MARQPLHEGERERMTGCCRYREPREKKLTQHRWRVTAVVCDDFTFFFPLAAKRRSRLRNASIETLDVTPRSIFKWVVVLLRNKSGQKWTLDSLFGGWRGLFGCLLKDSHCIHNTREFRMRKRKGGKLFGHRNFATCASISHFDITIQVKREKLRKKSNPICFS